MKLWTAVKRFFGFLPPKLRFSVGDRVLIFGCPGVVIEAKALEDWMSGGSWLKMYRARCEDGIRVICDKKEHGITLDPVYNGKLFQALRDGK